MNALLMLALALSALGAAPKGAPREPPCFDLEITPESTEVIAPGPIIVRVELSNPSVLPLAGSHDLYVGGSIKYEFLVDSEPLPIYFGGEVIAGFTGRVDGPPPPAPLPPEIPPGAAFTMNLVLFGTYANDDTVTLADFAGRSIQIRATHELNPSVTATTPPIKIIPRTGADRNAFGFWSDLGQFSMAIGGRVLDCGWWPNCYLELNDVVAAFLEKNPKDPAAVPMAMRLARNRAWRAINNGAISSRIDFDEARKWFRWILGCHPESFLAPEAAFGLAELANQDHDLDQVGRFVSIIEERFREGLDSDSLVALETMKQRAQSYAKWHAAPPNPDPNRWTSIESTISIPEPEIFTRKLRFTAQGNSSIECEPIVPVMSGNPWENHHSDLTITPQALAVDAPGPIIVRVEIRNPTGLSIVVNPRMKFNGSLKYEILDGSKAIEIIDRTNADEIAQDAQRILAGGFLVQILTVFGSAGAGRPITLASFAGRSVRIRVTDRSRPEVTATTPPIRVEARTGANQIALRFWQDFGEFSEAIGSGVLGCRSKGCHQRMNERAEEFLNRYPDDPASVSLALRLANDYRTEAVKNPGRPDRKSILECSRKWYEWILDRRPESFWVPEAAFRFVELSYEQEDVYRTEQLLNQIEENCRDGLDWQTLVEMERMKDATNRKLVANGSGQYRRRFYATWEASASIFLRRAENPYHGPVRGCSSRILGLR